MAESFEEALFGVLTSEAEDNFIKGEVYNKQAQDEKAFAEMLKVFEENKIAEIAEIAENSGEEIITTTEPVQPEQPEQSEHLKLEDILDCLDKIKNYIKENYGKV